MNKEETKQALIEELTAEKERMSNLDGFDPADHAMVIAYLEGKFELNSNHIVSHLKEYEDGLLAAAIYDYETLVHDYLT